jgi:hypothetical protein
MKLRGVGMAKRVGVLLGRVVDDDDDDDDVALVLRRSIVDKQTVR